MNDHEITEHLARCEAALVEGNYDVSEHLATQLLAELAAKEQHQPSTGYTRAHVAARSVLGNTARLKGDFYLALEHFESALAISEAAGDDESLAKVLGSIGVVYRNLSDYPQALSYLRKTLELQEKLQSKRGVAGTLHNIGNIYQNLSDHSRALEYLQKALIMNEELGRKDGVAVNLSTIGNVYGDSGEYPRALEYYQRAFAINKELGRKPGMASNYGNIGLVYQHIGDYERALENLQNALACYYELGNAASIASTLGNIGTLYAESKWEGYNASKAEEFLLKAIDTCGVTGAKNHVYSFHKALADFYEYEERWKESHHHYKKYHIIEKQVQSEQAKRQAEKQAYERKEADREKALAVAHARAQATDDILANILPRYIIERLINGEKKIADSHDRVSVLFIDIVGFTNLSASIPASELIDLLDMVFTRFDTICKKHGLEKIKTIGDAYMAVCGAPLAIENHAEQAAKAALEMMEKFTIEGQFSLPIHLQFRIGLHCGTVVSGVIGENKYSYDLWGDAVNTASRMESHGEAGKIHVSEDFKLAAGEKYTFVDRGIIDIKGKGKMKTYFLLPTAAL
ncbi:MAG: adenylate/guanylate cyclase domain-containing protein [Candidatus Kapaibacterium sp.]